MIIEINLLPEKEPKKIGLIVTLSSLLALLLLAGSYYIWQINAAKQEMSAADQQMETMNKLAEKEKSVVPAESASSFEQLESAIDWAKNYPIQTVPLMRSLTSLLPERGFIQSFGYTEEGTITLTVQFDSEREAAYFLNHLNGSSWIEDVSLTSLSVGAAPSVSAGSSSSGAAGQTDPANSSVNNSQTPGANPASSAAESQYPSVNTPSNSTNQVADHTILPRYTGQFEITLNKDAVKNMMSKSKIDEKGAAGS